VTSGRKVVVVVVGEEECDVLTEEEETMVYQRLPEIMIFLL